MTSHAWIRCFAVAGCALGVLLLVPDVDARGRGGGRSASISRASPASGGSVRAPSARHRAGVRPGRPGARPGGPGARPGPTPAKRRSYARSERRDFYEDHWRRRRRYVAARTLLSYRCHRTVIVHAGVSYTRCGSVWYRPVYYSSTVHYVVTAAPAQAEVLSLPADAAVVEVNGSTYYVSGGTFHQKVIQSGKTRYIVVDPPLGAEVYALPDGAIEVSVNRATYYQYDTVFYRAVSDRTGTSYVIVEAPY